MRVGVASVRVASTGTGALLRQLVRTFVACLAVALALAACDSDGTVDPTESAATTSPASSEPTTGPSSEPAASPSSAAPSEPATSESESEAGAFEGAVVLEPDGIGILTDEDSITHFTFGQADLATTAPALESQLGPATSEEDLEECGPGPLHSVSWPGLTIYFQEDTLEGWYVQAGGSEVFTTLEGIGLGSTRVDLEAAFADLTVEESTIGIEWSGGGMAGILTEDSAEGEVEVIWSGLNCIAR